MFIDCKSGVQTQLQVSKGFTNRGAQELTWKLLFDLYALEISSIFGGILWLVVLVLFLNEFGLLRCFKCNHSL